jgi:hypothetical protein
LERINKSLALIHLILHGILIVLRKLPIPPKSSQRRTSTRLTPAIGLHLQQFHSCIHSSTFFISKKPASIIRKLIAGNVKRRQWRYLVLTATFGEVPSEWLQKLKGLQ